MVTVTNIVEAKCRRALPNCILWDLGFLELVSYQILESQRISKPGHLVKKLTKIYKLFFFRSFIHQNKGFDLLKDSLYLTDFYEKLMAYIQYA